MSIPQRWRKFRSLSRRRRFLLLEAAFWLVVARLAVVFVYFPRIARRIGRLHAPADLQADLSQERAVAREISWAIDRSARLLPVRLVCLPQDCGDFNSPAVLAPGCRGDESVDSGVQLIGLCSSDKK
jgi:hypothetical protein